MGPGSVELCRVLIHQVSVLGPTTSTKVFDLHDFRQNSLVELVLKSGRGVVSLEDTLLKMEVQ